MKASVFFLKILVVFCLVITKLFILCLVLLEKSALLKVKP